MYGIPGIIPFSVNERKKIFVSDEDRHNSAVSKASWRHKQEMVDNKQIRTDSKNHRGS